MGEQRLLLPLSLRLVLTFSPSLFISTLTSDARPSSSHPSASNGS